MGEQLLKTLFTQFSDSDCKIQKIKIESDNQVSFYLYFPTFEENVINSIHDVFVHQFPSLSLSIDYVFGENCFSEKAVPFVIDRIREQYTEASFLPMPVNIRFVQRQRTAQARKSRSTLTLRFPGRYIHPMFLDL